jgi:nucleolar pre-ribosomal-associated protein 1
VKTVILAFRRPAFQKDMMRESITRLLRLYYEVAPQVALQEKFDISIPLCTALTQAEKATESSEERAFCVMELEHWIQIAINSPSVRWWQKTSRFPLFLHLTITDLFRIATALSFYYAPEAHSAVA